jgi:hypothetical protein
MIIYTLIFVFLICVVMGWFVHAAYKETRKNSVARAAEWAAHPPEPVTSGGPATSTPVPQARGTNPVVIWNVVVIVVGIFIAVIGLINGLTSNPDNSAFRQTVGALWVIQGLLGLLIAAIGILGAGVVYAISRLPQK